MGSPLLLLLLLWLPTGSPVVPAPEHESPVAFKSCLVPALSLSLLVQALTPHPESLQHKQEPSSHHILTSYNTNRNPVHTTSWNPTTQTGTQFTPHPEILQHKQEPNSHHILKSYNTNRNPIHTTSWKPTTQTGTQFTPHPESYYGHHIPHTSHLKRLQAHHILNVFMHTS